jgi:serine/threonine-protein kinase
VIHRDLKPSNVLVGGGGEPYVLDFGLARQVAGPDVTQMTTAGHVAGTLPYMSPEQASDQPHAVDIRSDVYSLGVILFEMLVPRLPLPKANSPKELLGLRWSLKDRFFQKKPSELNPNIDKKMDDIVKKALSFHPEKRYATCRAFMKDLEAYRTGHITNQ